MLPEWIDYNGHMNVAYYTLAFDGAIDWFLDNTLGIGARFVEAERQGPYTVQSNLHYLAEMLEGEAFAFRLQLIDSDTKRMHVILEMLKPETEVVVATCEQMLINVDLTSRRAAPYAPAVLARLERLRGDHARLVRPKQAGQPLGLRRAG